MSPKDPADETGRLLEEVAHLRAELTARDTEIARLNELVDQDMFLPILNRRAFERELARAWSSAQRYGFEIALIYLDLDGMKLMNDEHGHDTGDKALVVVANALVRNSRESDIVGRLGGDEFALLMNHADQNQGQKKAAQLSETIAEQMIETSHKTITVTASFGVSDSLQAENAATLIKLADEKMYQMKIAKMEHQK